MHFNDVLLALRQNEPSIVAIHFLNTRDREQSCYLIQDSSPHQPIHVEGVQLSSSEIGRLVDSLQHNTNLQSITIEGSHDNERGFSLTEQDIQTLLTCESVKNFNLTGNKLSRNAVRLLAESTHLNELTLGDCKITIPDLFLLLKSRSLTAINGLYGLQEAPEMTASVCQDTDIVQLANEAEWLFSRDTLRLALRGDNDAKIEILSYFNQYLDSGYVLENLQSMLIAGAAHDIKTFILSEAFRIWQKKINLVLENNMLSSMHAQERLTIESLREQTRLEKALIEAIEHDDDITLEALVSQLPGGVNSRLRYGDEVADGVPDGWVYTPLTIAAEDGKLKCVQKLLSMGANIELPYKDLTPQFLAAENGHDEVVNLLLAHAASMKGEFEPEDTLSIAAFKYNHALIQLIRILSEFDPKTNEINRIVEETQTLVSTWNDLFARGDLVPWQAFNDSRFKFDLTTETIPYYYLLNELSEQIELDPEMMSTLRHYKCAWEQQVERYVSMFKTIDIEELEQEDPYLTDGEESEVEQELVRQITKPKERTEGQQIPRPFIANTINQLNKEIRVHGIENIDWSKYPKLFIAQYRGIHFYRNIFSPEQRRAYRRTSHLNRHTPSSASIELSGGTPATHQYTRESEIERSIARLRDWNVSLESIKNCEAYWPTSMAKTIFETARDLVQNRYSNSMAGFLNDLKQNPGNNEVLKAMQSLGFKQVPYLSTSDKPEHALKYAFGQKSTEILRKWRLRPRFTQAGVPKRPYPGKLNIFLFSASEYHKHDFNHVFSMNAGDRTRVGARIVSEREASTAGGIYQPCNFYEETLQVPSLSSKWTPEIEAAYGLTQRKYTEYQQELAKTTPGTAERKLVKNKIIDTVISHKEKQLLEIAHKEAIKRGGYLVYRGLGDGKIIQFRLVEPPGKEVTSRRKKRSTSTASKVTAQKRTRLGGEQNAMTHLFEPKTTLSKPDDEHKSQKRSRRKKRGADSPVISKKAHKQKRSKHEDKGITAFFKSAPRSTEVDEEQKSDKVDSSHEFEQRLGQ